MSKNIICPNCHFHNPAGSKFCNNCGEKLPLSTTILCPNCDTANQIDRIFCDTCGTRLVQDATLADDKPKKEEKAPDSGPKPFSLPMRRPGDTGELNPDLLPAWLRKVSSGDDESDSAPADDDETTERPERPTTEELTRIENLSAGTDRDDELPDWLLDQIDSDPIIPEAEGITTELYLDLVKADPELADIAALLGDDSTAEAGPFDEEADLPNWLEDSMSPAAEDGGAMDEADDLLSSETIDSEDDVLSGLTDILVDPATQQEGSGIGLTDWLSDPEAGRVAKVPSDTDDDAQPGLTDWLSEAFVPEDFSQEGEKGEPDIESDLSNWLSEDFADESAPVAPGSETGSAGLTDWLSEAFLDDEDDDKTGDDTSLDEGDPLVDWLSDDSAFGTDLEQSEITRDETAAALDSEPGTEGGGLTNWLTNLDDLEKPNDEGDWFSDLPNDQEQEAGLTDWLQGLNQLTDSQLEFSTENREDDDEEDWLSDLDEGVAPADSPETERSTGSLSVTDWLSDSGPLTPEDAPEPPVSEDEAAPGELTQDEMMMLDLNSEFDANVPGWLGHQERDGDDIDEKAIAQSELDWMLETGDVDLPGGAEDEDEDDTAVSKDAVLPEGDRDDGGDDTLDWLADMEDIETGLLQVPDAPDEDAAPVPDESAVDDLEDLFSFDAEEVASAAEDEDDWDDTNEFLESEGAVGELPEWMTALGPPVGSQPEEKASTHTDINEEIPDWVDQLRPDEVGDDALLKSSLPSILRDDEDIDMSGLPLDVEDGEMPEWLDIDDSEADEDVAERSQDVPEWLGDSDSVQRGSIDEWDSSLLDKLPPPQKEPQLTAADIPQWLQKFKPEELQDGEEADRIYEEGEEEGEIESVIGGLNGVIKVETAILPSIPSKLQSTLMITPAQTSQIELLRQLYKEHAADKALEEKSVSAIHLPNLLEVVLVIVVLLALAIGWNAPGAIRFIGLPTATAANTAAVDQLQSVSNETVALAVAYTPAMAGEMTEQTMAIVDELLANNNRIIPMTQHVTSVGLLQSDLGFTPEEIIFVPGDAIGLRLFGECLNGDAIACTAVPQLEDATLASEIERIILVAAERDALVNWIEQVTAVTELPLLVSTTQSLAPMTAPYVLSEQIDGVVVHQSVTASRFSEEALQRTLQRQNKASTLAQIVVLVVFLFALVFYGAIRPTHQRRSQTSL